MLYWTTDTHSNDSNNETFPTKRTGSYPQESDRIECVDFVRIRRRKLYRFRAICAQSKREPWHYYTDGHVQYRDGHQPGASLNSLRIFRLQMGSGHRGSAFLELYRFPGLPHMVHTDAK